LGFKRKKTKKYIEYIFEETDEDGLTREFLFFLDPKVESVGINTITLHPCEVDALNKQVKELGWFK